MRLESELVTVTIDAARGARIQSVADALSGRELLVQRTPQPGGYPDDAYLAACTGGWDQLFPNDEPWRHYGSHGVLWGIPFSVVDATPDSVELRAEAADPCVVVGRRYRLLPAPSRGVRCEATLEALADVDRALWAEHPMLAVEPGWSAVLQPEPAGLSVDEFLPGRLAPGPLPYSDWLAAACVPETPAGLCELTYARGAAGLTMCSGSSVN